MVNKIKFCIIVGMDNFQTSGGSGNEASNDENSMRMDDEEMTDKEVSENTEPMAGTSKENTPKKGKEDSNGEFFYFLLIQVLH